MTSSHHVERHLVLPIPHVLRRLLPQHSTDFCPAGAIEPTGDVSLLAQRLADQYTTMSDSASLPPARVLTPRAMQGELLAVVEQTLGLSRTVAHLIDCAASGPVSAEQMAALAEACCQLRGCLPHLYTAAFSTCDDPDSTTE
ncbi:hypothetical protein [Streptomyces sp. NPDC001205]